MGVNHNKPEWTETQITTLEGAANGIDRERPRLAVLSLSGGNDGLNTVIPRNNSYYRDFRPTIGVPEDQILPINDELGFHPTMAPLMKYGKPDSWPCSWASATRPPATPLPQHGHLAHLRARNHRHRGWLGRAAKLMDPNAGERADFR